MSTHGAAADEVASAHAHPVFDGEPAKQLAADEPRTPGWLPAVGAVLFVVAAVWFLAISKDELQPEGVPSANPAAAAAPPEPPRPAPAAKAPTPLPVVTADGKKIPEPPASAKRFTPEEAAKIRDRMLDLQKKVGMPKPKKLQP